jgi:hypothetical protein
MTLPGEFNTCTMTGTVVNDQGLPLVGMCHIIPSVSQMATDGTATVVSLSTQTFMLDEFGGFSVTLISSEAGTGAPLDIVWILVLPSTNENNVSTITFNVPSGVSEALLSQYVLTTGNARSTYFRGGIWGPI